MSDQIADENALICEKLLGWTQSSVKGYWYPSDKQAGSVSTPRFTSWYHAGLILDALKAAGEKPRVFVRADEQWGCMGWHCGGVGSTAFAAIRAAALEYIKAVES